MKKKLFLTAFACFMGATAFSQGSIVLTTEAPIGTKIEILANASSATAPISIDYGNGIAINYTIDPSQPAYNRWIDATVEGTTITVTGAVTEFELQEAQLTSVQIEGMDKLKTLDLSKNNITDFQLLSATPLELLNLNSNNIINNTSENPTLTLEQAGSTLRNLSLSNNAGLICLDISSLTALEYITANNCPELASVFLCLPEESRPALRNIDFSNCALMHFYPVTLPALTSLNLANNNLISTDADTDPFVLGDYPELRNLDISGNAQIEYLDVTSLTKLETFTASDNKLESIDLSQATELISLYIANNNLTKLDLGNNTQIRNLNVAGNNIGNIDFEQMLNLQEVNISNTRISRAVLMYAAYLTKFEAANTLLEFVDFNGQQPGRMSKIDLRNCPNFTAETMNYTLHTLPVAKTNNYGGNEPNLLLTGSNAENADVAYATSPDLNWIADVTGDATAKNDLVAVTIDATDTGENKSGSGYRLYPHFGMEISYDLDIYSTDGGKFLISQWLPEFFQEITTVTSEARIGVPIHIYPYPEEGKRFKSVTVNGKEIYSQWFVISEPSEISVNFVSEEPYIKITTTPGQNLSFLINTIENNGTVWVDWGTGTRTEYTGQSSYQFGATELGGYRIEGAAAASEVTIYGDISAIDLHGYGDTADFFGLWDNAITAIDLTNASDLQYLNLYWNPISSIDLSGLPNLAFLDLSYTNLQSIDLSKISNIMYLNVYSDGFGEDGIAQLTELDVTNQPLLQYLDAKNNKLSSIDLSKNPYLYGVKLNNNLLTTLDISANPDLELLEVNDNRLSTIDLSNNTKLISLAVGGNNLTSLDLSGNEMLKNVNFANNDIHFIDLSKNVELTMIYLNGNGMTAGELNDIYYLLPQRPADADDDVDPSVGQLSYNIAVIQGGDKTENDGNRADSSIAVDRGWTPSHLGTNGGCDVVYLDILPSENGSIVVKDQAGNVYTHGAKVPKYEQLIIEATPAEGYIFKSFSLNGEAPIAEQTFQMPGIYTKLQAHFELNDGVENTLANAINITSANGEIIIKAQNTNVAIYNLAGILVAQLSVNGIETVALAPGLYIVKATSAEGELVTKLFNN